MTRFYLVFLFAFSALAAHAGELPKSPKTLAAALTQVNWNPQRQGAVLLVVAPERAAALVSDSPDAPAPPELFHAGYDLNALAAYYGRLRQRYGTVVTLAPSTMTVLNTHPGPANIYADLKRANLMSFLQASLTPAQWKQIGSPDGLGVGAMTDDQRKMWDAILPNPMTVDKTNSSYVGRKSDPEKTFHLTPAQRADVRLRIVKQTTTETPPPGGATGAYYEGQMIVFESNRENGNKEFLDLVGDNQYDFRSKPTLFGQPLLAQVPSTLKRGDLAFDAPALSASVSLNGPLTVGILIKRIDAAAHIELYADKRIQALPVFIRGDTAPAGNILKAVCLDIGGAIRQVGPAFVLTYDTVGLASQHAVQDDWRNEAENRMESLKMQNGDKIKSAHPQQYIDWADDEPLKLSPKLLAQVTTIEKGKSWVNTEVPISMLTLEQQQFVRDAIAKTNKRHPDKAAIVTDRVSITVGLWQSFIVPGLGEAPGVPLATVAEFSPEAEKDNAIPKPIVLPPDQTLYVQANTSAEAIRAVGEAVKRGMTRLWLPVTLGGDLMPLKAAIQAGKLSHLPVMAAVRLLSRPAGLPNADINVLGQTLAAYTAARPTRYYGKFPLPAPVPVDWARIDQPALEETLRSQLVRLAETPNLAGIVLRDIAAPGFDSKKSAYFSGYRDGAAETVGYTPALRLAFLRQYGADPTDILPNRGGGEVPFFEDEQATENAALTSQWGKYRYEGSLTQLVRLYAAVRQARPALPLWVQAQTRASFSPWEWYALWSKPNILPSMENVTWEPSTSLSAAVRGQSRVILLSSAAKDVAPENALNFARNTLDAEQIKGWDGVILDASTMPFKDGLAFIDNLKIDPARR